MNRLRSIFTLLILGCLIGTGLGQSIPRDVRLQILEAVVQIIPWDDSAGQQAPWSGSGTIISPDGYILTNFHVIGDEQTRQYFEYHAIFMTDPAFTDQPPRFSYWARYVASDPTHDLAILRIVEYPDESPIPADLTFKSAAVGDSNSLFPGDTITIVGYPGISGSTITFTAGLMSGWVGEDFETGGKQWIKTDAKISHGNSGGAAFNNQGELIGVPTAGRTVQWEELDVEEQAYVRPISLAWALIGPNVANVTRAGQAQGPTTTTTTTTTTGTTGGGPSGTYGSLAPGEFRDNVLAAATQDALVWHTYTVTVPPGLATLTISVDGMGSDVDLAVKAGAEITSYDPDNPDYDYGDFSEEPNPSYTIANPAPGTVYIDVVNLIQAPASYRLAVTAEGTQVQNPLAPGGNPLAPPGGEITTRITTSDVIGMIAPGQRARGSLEGLADAASYHTYMIDVAPQTARLTIRMTADQDLDLAVKFGSEIQSYSDKEEGGDWDYRDVSIENFATFVIDAPQPGRWYVDVYNALGASVTGAYTLEIE